MALQGWNQNCQEGQAIGKEGMKIGSHFKRSGSASIQVQTDVQDFVFIAHIHHVPAPVGRGEWTRSVSWGQSMHHRRAVLRCTCTPVSGTLGVGPASVLMCHFLKQEARTELEPAKAPPLLTAGV